MSKPVLIVVDDQPQSLAAVEGALRRRYEHDYLVISHTCPVMALNHLARLRAAGRPIAVVLAAASMTETSGAGFLAQVRSSQSDAKRVLIVPRGGPAAPSLRVPAPLLQDRSAALPVLQAMARGTIDGYLPAPGAEPDEQFHRGVSELLEEWACDAAPVLPAVWIIGERQSAHSHQLRDVLARNSIPYVFDAADSEPGRAMLEQAGQDGSVLPVLVMYTGEVLVNPPAERLAAAFGLAALPPGTVDVAIIGAGPAGLSAAVCTASEGLSTLLLEREAFGGQAGSSSLIRNYLGFPHGVTGASLAARAFEQAWSFGAVPSMAGPVTGLQPAEDGYLLSLGDGGQASARTVVIATGVSYRKLTAPGVDGLLGAGIFYGATTSEASTFGGQHVFVVGAANSAGQAAVNLARHAAQVTILARGGSLAARMSQYLIEEISATPNIDVRPDTEVARAHGSGELEALTLTNNKSGVTTTVPASALVVLIGAEPRTGWLPAGIVRDEHGFILTSRNLTASGGPPADWPLDRPPLLMETSMPGIFAAGDVRHRSLKRVASAVGEGSTAATQASQHLREQAQSKSQPGERRPLSRWYSARNHSASAGRS